MPRKHPRCYIIAGPNGVGKTTFARDFLPREVDCREFVNPDLIAQGLSPFDPTLQAAHAARLVLSRINELSHARADFAIETTLAGRTHLRLFAHLKESGYRLHLFYLWVPDPALSLLRIRDRVRHGGHDVPKGDVLRRFRRSLANLAGIYAPVMDSLVFYDNSMSQPRVVFTDTAGRRAIMLKQLYERIMEESKS